MADSSDEQEEEEADGLGTSHLRTVLTKNQLNWWYSDGFFDQEELVPQQPRSPFRSLVSAAESGDNDREEIEEYVKSIKRRAQESGRIGGSSGGSSSTQDRRPELWTLPVPVRLFYVVLLIG